MTVGLLVDGLGEFFGLPEVLVKLRATLPEPVRNPLKIDLQPGAPLPLTAQRCINRIRLLEGQVTGVVVVIDREQHPDCSPKLADALASLIQAEVQCSVSVVIKDRCLENWLVSDFDAVARMRARFAFSAADRAAVVPNRADSANATAMLKRAVVRGSYEKPEDAVRILRTADPVRMAVNSRSFRRFLRVLKHPVYHAQSRNPAAQP